MSSVKDHYENHLADFYSWMTGDLNTAVKEQKEFFLANNIIPLVSKKVIDLGSGHGIQSLALAGLGFSVTAVDFSKKLIKELEQNSDGKVDIIEADIMEFAAYQHIKPELIVCMGDTLAHLNSKDDVVKLISNSAGMLSGEGQLILSFRSIINELTGSLRFIPVKSDENRILTCFLEYSDEFVTVYDILHENDGKGWNLKVSSYNKLRLSNKEVIEVMEKNGLKIIYNIQVKGMEHIIAQKK